MNQFKSRLNPKQQLESIVGSEVDWLKLGRTEEEGRQVGRWVVGNDILAATHAICTFGGYECAAGSLNTNAGPLSYSAPNSRLFVFIPSTFRLALDKLVFLKKQQSKKYLSQSNKISK